MARWPSACARTSDRRPRLAEQKAKFKLDDRHARSRRLGVWFQSAWSPPRSGFQTPFLARALLLAVIALAAAGGMLVTDGAATAQAIAGAGGDWANLLRAMAVLKLLFAGAATAAVLWRLGAPISAQRWGGYAAAAAATWAGPGLIWGLAWRISAWARCCCMAG